MATNRSAPAAAVVPVLVYPDVRAAVDWLVDVFGFIEHVWIGPNHRAQLGTPGGGAVIVADERGERRPPRAGEETARVMVRVGDVHAHYEHALERGATILLDPTDWPYGERQYEAQDAFGHRWTFSQTIADVAPEAWGGVSVHPREDGR